MHPSSPWCDPVVATQQRALNDAELVRHPWPAHFSVYAAAIAETGDAGLSILEVGCGNGIGRAVVDEARARDPELPGLAYSKYTGADISLPALREAQARYPTGDWVHVVPGVAYRERGFDVVADTACLMHVQDWECHLAELCLAARHWLLLHRIPLGKTTHETHTVGYGKRFDAWRFGREELLAELRAQGWMPAGSYWLPDGCETWLCRRLP